MTRFRGSVAVFTAVLFLGGGALLFAGGQKETTGQQGATASGSAPTISSTLTTVTGKLQLANRIRPVVVEGSSSYELIVPRYEVYQAGVQQGETVTVKGYKVEGGSWGPYYGSATTDTTPMLLVSSATIGGKSYDLTAWVDHVKSALSYRGSYGPGRGFRGPGYGAMMGHGPRFGYGPAAHRGYGRDWHGYGPRNGRGYGPMYGPGFGGYGPGMGFRFQDQGSPSGQEQ